MPLLLILLVALLLDHYLGEPRRYHPLVGFGNYAKQLEKFLNYSEKPPYNKLMGLLSVLLAILPFYFLLQLLMLFSDYWVIHIFESIILYFAIGLQSLKKHAQAIYRSLLANNIKESQYKVSMIVSRDTDKMQAEDISRATIESVLENGNDAVFAPIFWFVIAGIPGVVSYRIINTLDAMWGYKITQYKDFGYTAAKLDDLLNYIPARLTALSYALMGNWQSALHCWKTQAQCWNGVNPGVVMASGSGALNIKLGGGDYYHGEYRERPPLGLGNTAQKKDIILSVNLLNRVVILWLGILFLIYYPSIL